MALHWMLPDVYMRLACPADAYLASSVEVSAAKFVEIVKTCEGMAYCMTCASRALRCAVQEGGGTARASLPPSGGELPPREVVPVGDAAGGRRPRPTNESEAST